MKKDLQTGLHVAFPNKDVHVYTGPSDSFAVPITEQKVKNPTNFKSFKSDYVDVRNKYFKVRVYEGGKLEIFPHEQVNL
jgi:hypothetical protein